MFHVSAVVIVKTNIIWHKFYFNFTPNMILSVRLISSSAVNTATSSESCHQESIIKDFDYYRGFLFSSAERNSIRVERTLCKVTWNFYGDASRWIETSWPSRCFGIRQIPSGRLTWKAKVYRRAAEATAPTRGWPTNRILLLCKILCTTAKFELRRRTCGWRNCRGDLCAW